MKSSSAPSDGAGRHRGITMHHMPVGGDFGGLVFAVGSVLIFLLALPEARWFALASVVAGLVFFALIRLLRRLRRTQD